MKNIIQSLKVVALGLMLAIGLSYAFAWTSPTGNPPTGNVSAPINTSSWVQYKVGDLGVGGVFEVANGANFAVLGGNVGIGTTAPTEKLHLVDTLSPAIQIVDTTNAVNTHWYANDTQGAVGTGSNHNFSIFTNDIDRMIINSTGNVGIGTTAPERNLHIGDGTGEAFIKLTSGSGSKAGLEFAGGVGPNMWKLERFEDDDILRFTKMGGPVGYPMVIKPTGEVGMGGIINPQVSLDVGGNIQASGTICGSAGCVGGGGSDWKILASGSDWTEEAIITLQPSGVTFTTDNQYATQRINVGAFNWPSNNIIEEISFKVENPSDIYCVGGGFTQNLTTGAGTYPKCQDFQYQGTVLSRVNNDEDDAIKIAINDIDMEYCPDQLGRKSNSATYPGTYGYLDYFSPECYYRAGTDYPSSEVTKIEVKEVDWSADFGKWTWEIWYR